MNYDFTNYKKDALDRPSAKAWSNWAKFEKKGDSVQGYIRDVFYREAEGAFKEARGITLEQLNGELINVSIKRVDFVLDKTDDLRLGDPLTVVYEADIAAKKAGFNPTKQYGYYGKNIPETEGQKTVKELEDEDMGKEKEDKTPTNTDAEESDFELTEKE